MKQSVFTLESARQRTADVWELTLSGDTSAITAPGQFVNIALPGRFLRRPISVCDWSAEHLWLLVKEAGEGTGELVRLPPGTALDVLSGLGNGFDLSQPKARTVLVGGGIGTAPLYGLAKRLLERGGLPVLVLGFRSKSDAVYLSEFFALDFPGQSHSADVPGPCPILITTEDGSLGEKGFVTDVITRLRNISQVFACGPTPMLKAVSALPQVAEGQFSFEARMACGFGACVGCTIQTANGPRRVCKDGPVFRKEEIVW